MVNRVNPPFDNPDIRKAMSLALDRMESQPAAFFDAVRAGYLTLAQNNPDRVRLLDSAGSIESLAERIWQELHLRLTT